MALVTAQYDDFVNKTALTYTHRYMFSPSAPAAESQGRWKNKLEQHALFHVCVPSRNANCLQALIWLEMGADIASCLCCGSIIKGNRKKK
jgi:hypothetical protein